MCSAEVAHSGCLLALGRLPTQRLGLRGSLPLRRCNWNLGGSWVGIEEIKVGRVRFDWDGGRKRSGKEECEEWMWRCGEKSTMLMLMVLMLVLL